MADNVNDPNYAAYQQAVSKGFGGMSSSDVKKVQNYLNVYHGAKLTVDGNAGPLTSAALTAGGGSADTSGTDATTTATLNSYGYLAAYIKDPEVGPIIMNAAKQGLDIYKLQGELYNTNFWKNTDAKARSWDLLVNTDSAEANRQVAQKKQDVINLARMTGMPNISDDMATQIATHSLREDWSTAQLTNALTAEMDFNNPSSLAGSALTTLDQLKKVQQDYALPYSDQQLGSWDKQIQEGTSSVDAFTSYAKQQAVNRYGWAADALNGGATVKDIAQPYSTIAQKTLGLNDADFDLTDPKWSAALTNTDPATGKSVQMSDADWTKKLKTDPTYGYANSAPGLQDKATQAMTFMQKLGFQ